MKKRYIKPSIEVTDVMFSTHIMAASLVKWAESRRIDGFWDECIDDNAQQTAWNQYAKKRYE